MTSDLPGEGRALRVWPTALFCAPCIASLHILRRIIFGSSPDTSERKFGQRTQTLQETASAYGHSEGSPRPRTLRKAKRQEASRSCGKAPQNAAGSRQNERLADSFRPRACQRPPQRRRPRFPFSTLFGCLQLQFSTGQALDGLALSGCDRLERRAKARSADRLKRTAPFAMSRVIPEGFGGTRLNCIWPLFNRSHADFHHG